MPTNNELDEVFIGPYTYYRDAYGGLHEFNVNVRGSKPRAQMSAQAAAQQVPSFLAEQFIRGKISVDAIAIALASDPADWRKGVRLPSRKARHR